MLYSDLPKNSKKRFLVITVDGLQDTARQTFGALRGLPHNRLEAILYEASKTGIGKIQDWLVKNSGWAEDAMQYIGGQNRADFFKSLRESAKSAVRALFADIF